MCRGLPAGRRPGACRGRRTTPWGSPCPWRRGRRTPSPRGCPPSPLRCWPDRRLRIDRSDTRHRLRTGRWRAQGGWRSRVLRLVAGTGSFGLRSASPPAGRGGLRRKARRRAEPIRCGTRTTPRRLRRRRSRTPVRGRPERCRIPGSGPGRWRRPPGKGPGRGRLAPPGRESGGGRDPGWRTGSPGRIPIGMRRRIHNGTPPFGACRSCPKGNRLPRRRSRRRAHIGT